MEILHGFKISKRAFKVHKEREFRETLKKERKNQKKKEKLWNLNKKKVN
jgi:hypothetical protein